MIKRSFLMLLLLIACLGLFFSAPCLAGADNSTQSEKNGALQHREPSIILYIDGQARPLQNPLLTRNGITYAPFWEFFSALGSEPGYTAHFNRLLVWAELGNLSFLLEAGTNVFYLNNSIGSLPAATFMHNGTLYFPLRFLMELCAYRIRWYLPQATGEPANAAPAPGEGNGVPVEPVRIYIFRPVSPEPSHTRPADPDSHLPTDPANAVPKDPGGAAIVETPNRARSSAPVPRAAELSEIPMLPSRFAQTARSVPVLMYHHLLPAAEHDGKNGAIVSVEEFQKQIDYLFKNGYYTVTLADLYLYIKGEKSLPKKAVVLTFDDGYRSNYDYAFPILQQYRFRAVQFPVTSLIEKSYPWLPHMGWDLMDEAASVFEYHSHSHYLHHYMNNRAALLVTEKEQIRRDLLHSRELLGCFAFAYPFGISSSEAIQLLKETGYKMAFTIRRGNVHPGDDLFTLKRRAVYPHTTLQEFSVMLQTAR
ncbi:MAG: polysaccharide deacetylase family protein [Bacillota bacterium]